MTQNPLDQFRRNQPPATAATKPEPTPARAAKEIDPATGKEIYEAYKASTRKSDRMEIRRVMGNWRAPSYRYLPDISFNGHFGTEMTLAYSLYTVYIKGKNLEPIIYAIEDGRCEFIQDYDAREFAPPHPAQPIIEIIEIRTDINFICPSCKSRAMAKPDAHLICGDCRVALVAR